MSAKEWAHLAPGRAILVRQPDLALTQLALGAAVDRPLDQSEVPTRDQRNLDYKLVALLPVQQKERSIALLQLAVVSKNLEKSVANQLFLLLLALKLASNLVAHLYQQQGSLLQFPQSGPYLSSCLYPYPWLALLLGLQPLLQALALPALALLVLESPLLVAD